MCDRKNFFYYHPYPIPSTHVILLPSSLIITKWYFSVNNIIFFVLFYLQKSICVNKEPLHVIYRENELIPLELHVLKIQERYFQFWKHPQNKQNELKLSCRPGRKPVLTVTPGYVPLQIIIFTCRKVDYNITSSMWNKYLSW